MADESQVDRSEEVALLGNVAGMICRLLEQSQQPSAMELLQACKSQCGDASRTMLKEAVISLLNVHTIPAYQKEYLKGLCEDGSLDAAIAGEGDCRDKREINTGIDRLIARSRSYRGSDEFREMIQFMGQFREYAPYNNMLVRVQNPSCSFYATAPDWEKRFKRSIKEDARPMLILAPMHPVMLVYDLDETEGADLPASLKNFSQFGGEWQDKWLERLIENASRHKIRVNFKRLSTSNSGFATYASGDWKMRIAIDEELDGPSRFGVLCHELAHIFLGHLGGDRDLWWPSRMNLGYRPMEIEAEATAYIVTQHLGLDGSSAAYVSNHLTNGETLPVGVSVDSIAKVSGKIEQMTKGMMPEPKPKKVRAV